jgi:hypothetical protein
VLGNNKWREAQVNHNTWSPYQESLLENLKFDELRIVQYNKTKESFESFRSLDPRAKNCDI